MRAAVQSGFANDGAARVPKGILLNDSTRSGRPLPSTRLRPTGIHGMTPKSVKKKMKTPAFAAAVDRDELRRGAEELGVDFDEHLARVIAAMEGRAAELGLEGEAAPDAAAPDAA